MSGSMWSEVRLVPRESDPATDTGYEDHPPRLGFFTDTSVCIGCKACEVACKEWNEVPEDGLNWTGRSHDNTIGLSGSTWRHVAFIEQRIADGTLEPDGVLPDAVRQPEAVHQSDAVRQPEAVLQSDGGLMGHGGVEIDTGPGNFRRGDDSFRWLMSSDVCKHCTHSACLDVCPTGAIFRTEFGTVVVQADICNGCGYCVPACPYGVLDRREEDGRVFKCTLCYDRLQVGQEPACAKACPTDSIQFGELEELRGRAEERVEELQAAGVASARLYGHDPGDGVGGDGAFFLLLDEPEVYGLPPDPVVTTRDLAAMWRRVVVAGVGLLAAGSLSFIGAGRPSEDGPAGRVRRSASIGRG